MCVFMQDVVNQQAVRIDDVKQKYIQRLPLILLSFLSIWQIMSLNLIAHSIQDFVSDKNCFSNFATLVEMIIGTKKPVP